MSLEDRIRGLDAPISPGKLMFVDIDEAATIAAEADELMREMATMLEDIFMISVDQRSSKAGVDISGILQKYYNLPEQNQ